jgi:hypothetical protein
MNNTYQDVNSIIDIEELKYQTLNRIPKKVFINNYAPLLFDPNPLLFNMKWLEVSSSPIHEVVMTDDNDKPICLIPPLRESNLEETSNSRYLNTEFDIYTRQRDTQKNISENRLMDALSKVNLSIGVTETLSKRWLDLLINCGFEQNIVAYNQDNKSSQNEMINQSTVWDVID